MEYRFYPSGMGADAITLKLADCVDDAAAMLEAIQLATASGRSTEAWQGNSLVCRVPASGRSGYKPNHAC